MNREGMTWEEWAYAAGLLPASVLFVEIGGHRYPFDPLAEERRAWNAGEDPTEWKYDRSRRAIAQAAS